MKKTLIFVYAVCATVMITGSLLWFIFTLQSDSQQGKTEAQKSFKILTGKTADILNGHYTEPAQLSTRLEQLCRNHYTYIQTVLIRSEKGLLFIWPQDAGIFEYTERHTVQTKKLPLFFIPVQTVIPPINSDSESFTVHAVLKTLPIGTIVSRGKTVFILMLLLFLITITLLIFSYVDVKPPATPQQHAVYRSSAPPAAQEPETDSSQPVRQEAAAPQQSRAVSARPAADLSAQLESLNHLHICNTDEQEPMTAPHTGIPSKAAAGSVDAEIYGSFENHLQAAHQAEKEERDRLSIDAEDTGTDTPKIKTAAPEAEQAKLIEELTSAITETAMAEEDLALLFIRVNGLAQNEAIIKSIRTQLDKIHKLFFFDEHTIALLVYYAPLDKAMHIASNLYDSIYPFAGEDVSESQLGLGLTTRAGRIIPAYRMVEEAVAAINKAVVPGSDPIVAFRVNAEKYRKCLAQLNDRTVV